MDFETLANDIQRCLNSLASLDIKSTENNMAHLWGSMQTLAGVRDTLRTYAEAQAVNRASGDPAGGPESVKGRRAGSSGDPEAAAGAAGDMEAAAGSSGGREAAEGAENGEEKTDE